MIKNPVKLLSLFIFNQSFSQPLCDFMYVDTLNVNVVHDSIYIKSIQLCGYCNSSFEIAVYKVSDTLYVSQTDTVLNKATCGCLFDITTCIFGLDPGSYDLHVQRYKLEKFGYPFDTLLTIGHKRIIIDNNIHKRSSGFNFSNYQSDCISSKITMDKNSIPIEFKLLQNYPNPFNTTTTISFDLPQNDRVNLKVFDMKGREVAALIDFILAAGTHHVQFDAQNMPSGQYIYQLTCGEFKQVKTMVQLK